MLTLVAFMRNPDYPCAIYNFAVLSIIASTSMMVSLYYKNT